MAARSAAMSRIVGKKSTLVTTVSQVVPGLTTPGHRTIIGSRMPPSYIFPLPALSGAFDVTFKTPPLSDMKKTIVWSARPSLSSVSHTRPTHWSTLSIIAAYVALCCGFSGFAFAWYLAIMSFLAISGICTA